MDVDLGKYPSGVVDPVLDNLQPTELKMNSLFRVIGRNVVSIKRSPLFSPSTQPDAWKVIPHRSFLYPSRVFHPRIKDGGPVPLIIMVHGGGFIMNNPSVDDPLARFLADNCNCVIVSIDYRKAPRHPFPAAYEDIVESISALLGDSGTDLSIDWQKVILCGSSAGGNLALAAAQDTRLQGKLLGIVALYPAVNLAATVEEQMATRPDQSVPDFIGGMWNDLQDIYVGTSDATTLKNPQLSPSNFEKRDDLPKHIYFIGCEHDMLCSEAKVMAERLVERPASQEDQTADDWLIDNVRWKLIKGQTHAFEHFAKKDRDEEEKRVHDKDIMYRDIAQWLRNVLRTV